MGSKLTHSKEFQPGDIGEIIRLHAQHYGQNWGFGVYFETKVATELAEFATRKTTKDLVLLARDEHGLAASMIIDLNDPNSGERGGHLRWFIVSDRCRGTGIGREMMQDAMKHCDQATDGKCWLTTFAGLAPARHLYESFGFQLCHEQDGEAWGTKVTEQEFRRA